MVKKSQNSKLKNRKKNITQMKDNLDVFSNWQAYVLLPGSVSDTTHVVPAHYIENLEPPVFETEKFYDIFWSPYDDLTLEDLQKTKTEIQRFREKSADADAGYYKGYVLLLEVSAEAMEQALRQNEVRRTLAKRKGVTSHSSVSCSSSKDSGVTSIVSRVTAERGMKRVNNGDDMAGPPSKSFIMDKDVASDYEAADEENIQENCNNGAPVVQYEKRIKYLTAKLATAKSKILDFEEKIARLEKMNVSFQEHVLECIKIRPCQCQMHQPPKQVISGAHTAVWSSGTTSNQLGTKQKVAAINNGVDTPQQQNQGLDVSAGPVAGPSSTPQLQGIKLRDGQNQDKAVSAGLPTTSPPEIQPGEKQLSLGFSITEALRQVDTEVPPPTTPNSVEIQDLTIISLNDSDVDKLLPVHDVVIDDPELGALLQEYDNNCAHPTQAGLAAEQVPEENLDHIQFEPEPRLEDWVDAPEMVEIHPTVFVDKRVWHGSFKVWVEHPFKVYGYGKKGDIEFIKDGAMHVWGSDKLKSHSISGKQSNANLKKKPNAAPPGPPLPLHEIDAIIGALKRRVLLEQQKPVPEGVQPCTLRLDERCSPAAVKYEIGQKRISLLRMKKKQ